MTSEDIIKIAMKYEHVLWISLKKKGSHNYIIKIYLEYTFQCNLGLHRLIYGNNLLQIYSKSMLWSRKNKSYLNSK